MATLKYKLTRDTLFKLFFVKHPYLLKNLVSRVLGIALDDITKFVITNPNIAPGNLGDKFCRLDINMEINDQHVNLEVQVEDEGDYPARSLYYWARCYSSTLLEGDDYVDLPRTIVINIVAFKLFKDTADVHSEFRALEVTRHTELTDKMSLHYFELPKLPEVSDTDAGDGLKLWLALFNAGTDEELSIIEKIGGKTMEQAVQAYRSILASDDLKEIERLRFLARCNETSALNHARREGQAEGRAEGQAEAQQNFVKTMYQGGFSIAEIVRATGLSEQDINNILGI